MADYHINVFYSEEDGGYIADIPDLRGPSSPAVGGHLGSENSRLVYDRFKRCLHLVR